MDDTAEPCWTWPYWKFGLKKDDLFSTLHDQYNTVPSPILDPEAFHHDVYEISQQASTTDELHRLLSDRRQQRLRELNETLESAAFEIIANPTLIGTEQWQHAVQLFRTKSLDSLVRYFASYLPSDHPWYKSNSSASHSEVGSSVGSLTDSHSSLFEDDESPIITEEPFEYPSYLKQLLPPSPRSMTICSDSSVASPIDDSHHDFDFTSARTLSFSESEPDCCDMQEESRGPCHCERVSQCADLQTTVATTTVYESVVAVGVELKPTTTTTTTKPSQLRNGEATLHTPSTDVTDSETPTPRPEAQSASFFDDTKDTKPSPPHRRYRSQSPSRPHPLSERDLDQVLSAHRDPRNPQQRLRLARKERERERASSPAATLQRRRRNPAEPATRVHKPLVSEGALTRSRSRRWAAAAECS